MAWREVGFVRFWQAGGVSLAHRVSDGGRRAGLEVGTQDQGL